jgi:hypothetical protein
MPAALFKASFSREQAAGPIKTERRIAIMGKRVSIRRKDFGKLKMNFILFPRAGTLLEREANVFPAAVFSLR